MNNNKNQKLFPLIIIILTIIIVFIIFFSSCKADKNNLKENPKKENSIKNVIYTCPMHPDIKQDKPGDCPICGMKLVPINQSDKNTYKHKDNTTSIIYTCPMHPDIKQDKPGDCPICGMKLVPINQSDKNTHKHKDNTTSIIYTCPMHPDIKQDKPGDCPICGMKLVPINQSDKNTYKHKDNTTSIIYTCPMHPDIKQDKPGDCPICGMKLVPINQSDKNTHKHKDNTTSIIYTCPMHPDIKQDKPGDCPICGMKLVPISNQTTTTLATSNNLTNSNNLTTSTNLTSPTHTGHSNLTDSNNLTTSTNLTSPTHTGHSNLTDTKFNNKLSFDNTIKINYDIKLYKAKYLTLKNEIKFNGYTAINESNKKSLSLNTDVWIKDTYNLFEGKYIRKGEPILKIYSLEIEQTKKELELVKDNPKLKEIILKKLNYLRISSYGDIDSDNIIRSPYDCILIEKQANEGDLIKANQSIYTFIINPETWIIAEIPVSYLKDIYIGKRVLVKTYNGDSFYSKIDYIFPNSDFESKTIKVRIKYSLKDSQIILPWNLPLEISILKTKTAIFVPIDSIINKGDKKIVFKKIDNNVFKPVYIKVNEYFVYNDEGYYEVVEGLKEGDEIAYSGVFLLDSEAKIKGIY